MPFLVKDCRAVARALIWGGGGGGVYSYSYIRVMPDGFLLKSVVFKLISKEISQAEHEYMNIHPPPPPPINALATALRAMRGDFEISWHASKLVKCLIPKEWNVLSMVDKGCFLVFFFRLEASIFLSVLTFLF